MSYNNTKGLKLLLSHPTLITLTLNQKYNDVTPVMAAVMKNRLEQLVLLVSDPRVNLETTDREGRSLEEVARWLFSSCILKITRPDMN